ncbi:MULTISPECIES: Uma2 family endonuclease [unclassified Microcoleus]|uniref:Uma2 family endonuclease n=1 Tax=unclassified Microcoleus TaxID=2642155 RepID=UPI002FD6DAC7
MVVAAKLTISIAEFLQLPETKPASEYIDGQISQKPMPQGKHSKLQDELLSGINRVGKPGKLAHAFPELRCTFGGRSIVPDIAVFEWSRIPLDEDGEIANRIEVAPDWIIEILSPDQSPNQVIKKIVFSINHGTKLGWFADPGDKSVIVFQPNQLPEFKSDTDILPVLSVLGDWQLSAAELFSWLKIN